MDPTWLAVQYLVLQARSRITKIRAGQADAGALTLEWIVIAAVLFAAATAALLYFRKAVKGEEAKLP